MDIDVATMEDFRYWVSVQLAIKKTTQKQLATKMNVADTRISEAINGRKSGEKYIIPLIKALDGNVSDFKRITERSIKT